MIRSIIYALGVLLIISFVSCTKNIGKVEITYQKATPLYGNLEEVRSTPINDTQQEMNNPGKIYVGESFILIGEEEKGIHVFDNTNRDNPTHINFINIPGNREFFVQGNYLYAETYYDVIKLDISNLSNVVLENRAEFAIQEELKDNQDRTLLGFSFTKVTEEVEVNGDIYEALNFSNNIYFDYAQNIIPASAVPSSFAGNSQESSGTVNRITRTADHVYILGSNRIIIIDDSSANFNKVEIESNVWFPWEMETIFPYEDKLFVGSRSSMNIYDISNPTAPRSEYQFNHATSCDPVLPTERAAYVTLRTADFSDCPGDINALVVLDIEDLQNPREVREIQMTSPYGMSKIGHVLFVGEGESGLSVFDATDPLNPQLLKKDTSVEAYDIISHPTNPNVILIAGTTGLEQYEIAPGTLDLTLESSILY